MSEDPRSFDQIIARERGLRHSLSGGRMAMIAIGGAIGTGLFLGSGFAIGLAGPAVLVSYAVGALVSLLLVGCLAEMTVAHPTTGSFGTYAEYYLGPLAGFLVRYAYWTCVVLAVGTEVTAIGQYMHFWFPGLPSWVPILGFSGLLIAVNARSVAVFGAVEYCLSAIKVAAIIVFVLLAGYVIMRAPPAAAGSATPGFHNYVDHGGFFPHGAWGAWTAVIVAIFSYLSIEMIAVAAGEAQDPQRAVTRAFGSTVLRLILFYLVTLALVLAVVPWTAAGTDESPFVKVLRTLEVPWAAGVFNGVILIAALSAMNSQLYITSRMMFSLSRAGDAPRALGQLSASGVPVRALLVSSSGIAVAAALSLLAPTSAFALMVAISVFGAMFTWMMIFVTHYRFRRVRAAQPAAGFRMAGFPFTTLLGAALMAALLLTTAFTAAFRLTLLFGLPFLGALGLAYRLRRRRLATAGRAAVPDPRVIDMSRSPPRV